MAHSYCPAEQELDAFARQHFAYEVATLGTQFEEFLQRHADRIAGPANQALLEAMLVHLRLLDAFLGAPRAHRKKDARAPQWTAGGWEGRGFLSSRERDRIDAMVAHLTFRRNDLESWGPEDMPELICRCCCALQGFFEALGPRAKAFQGSRELVDLLLPLARQVRIRPTQDTATRAV